MEHGCILEIILDRYVARIIVGEKRSKYTTCYYLPIIVCIHIYTLTLIKLVIYEKNYFFLLLKFSSTLESGAVTEIVLGGGRVAEI